MVRSIVLAGLIGAGKTTLSRALGKEFGLNVLYEDDKDPVLQAFYGDMKANSFRLQIRLLTNRLIQIETMMASGGVIDRSIYEDRAFVELLHNGGLLDDEDYKTYINLSTRIFNKLPKPDCLIYLRVSPQTALSRIHARGREMEKNMTIEYLEALYAQYEKLLNELSKTVRVLALDWEEFAEPSVVAHKIKQMIEDGRGIEVVTLPQDF